MHSIVTLRAAYSMPMGQTVFLIVLIAAVLSLLAPGLQRQLRTLFRRRPAFIWALPVLFTTFFAAAMLVVDAFSLPLLLMMLAYTLAPISCTFFQGPADAPNPTGLDFLAILLLWLPIEFASGASLVPRAAQGFLHSVAYGIAIL